jgi:hypothetical protein
MMMHVGKQLPNEILVAALIFTEINDDVLEIDGTI